MTSSSMRRTYRWTTPWRCLATANAHAVLLSSARSQVAIDDLRQAMVQYRELLTQLVGEPPVLTGPAGDPGAGSDHPDPALAEQAAADDPARTDRRGDR